MSPQFSQPSRAMHAHGFLAIQKHHSTRVHGQRYENQHECSKDTYEFEIKNQSCVISGFRREVDDICSLLGYSLQTSRKRLYVITTMCCAISQKSADLKNKSCSSGKQSRHFFNMVSPDPTLQRWHSTWNYKLFHTIPTAPVWSHMTSGGLQL
jgi:hypothetical protein